MTVATIYVVYSKQSYHILLVSLWITIGIWFTAVYSCHHYIIDVILGIATALIGVAIFEKGILRIPAINHFFQRYINYVS